MKQAALIGLGLLILLGSLLGPGLTLIKPNHPDSWVIVVKETSDRSPVVARIQSDTQFWENLASRRLFWRFYDADSPDAEQYKEAIKETGLPALLILTTDGTVLDARPIPATVDGINQVIIEKTGME
jgi:hypothetical protein